MEPKVNEVWWTKNERIVLFVSTPTTPESPLSMLWFDEPSKEWTVSPILDRLSHRAPNHHAKYFFIGAAQMTPEQQ